MESWVPTQRHWLKAAGCAIGAVARTRREERTLRSLVQKGFAAEDGQITEAGLAVYDRRVARISA